MKNKILAVPLILIFWFITTGFFGSSVEPIKAGNKVGVVLMHGKGGTTKHVDSLASALRSAGVQVITPDMPWHQNRIFDKSFTDSMAEINSHVRQLKNKGAETIFVGGHSIGAIAAAGYASRYDDISGIVLLAPGHFVSMNGFNMKVADDIGKAQKLVNQGKGNTKTSLNDFNMGKKYRRKVTPEIYLSWFAFGGEADFPGNMSKLNDGIAVLYIGGTEDKIPGTQDKGYAFDKAPDTVHNTFTLIKSDHLDVPSKAKKNVASWIDNVTSFDADAFANEMISNLQASDKSIRREAENKLELLGNTAQQPLISALKHDDAFVRSTAASLLGNIEDEAVVQALIDALKDNDAEVRWSVVTALEEIGDKSAKPALEKMKNDKDEDVRDAVTDALDSMS